MEARRARDDDRGRPPVHRAAVEVAPAHGAAELVAAHVRRAVEGDGHVDLGRTVLRDGEPLPLLAPRRARHDGVAADRRLLRHGQVGREGAVLREGRGDLHHDRAPPVVDLDPHGAAVRRRQPEALRPAEDARDLHGLARPVDAPLRVEGPDDGGPPGRVQRAVRPVAPAPRHDREAIAVLEVARDPHGRLALGPRRRPTEARRRPLLPGDPVHLHGRAGDRPVLGEPPHEHGRRLVPDPRRDAQIGDLHLVRRLAPRRAHALPVDLRDRHRPAGARGQQIVQVDHRLRRLVDRRLRQRERRRHSRRAAPRQHVVEREARELDPSAAHVRRGGLERVPLLRTPVPPPEPQPHRRSPVAIVEDLRPPREELLPQAVGEPRPPRIDPHTVRRAGLRFGVDREIGEGAPVVVVLRHLDPRARLDVQRAREPLADTDPVSSTVIHEASGSHAAGSSALGSHPMRLTAGALTVSNWRSRSLPAGRSPPTPRSEASAWTWRRSESGSGAAGVIRTRASSCRSITKGRGSRRRSDRSVTARWISSSFTAWLKPSEIPASGITPVVPPSTSMKTSARRGVEKSIAKGSSSAAPSSARVPAGTSTWKAVAGGSCSSASNRSAALPTQWNLPFAAGRITTGGGGSAGRQAERAHGLVEDERDLRVLRRLPARRAEHDAQRPRGHDRPRGRGRR